MQTPKATIALLSYNQASYVEDAARSVLAQTLSPLEVILSDDASQDDSFERLSAIASSYEGPHIVRLNRNASNLGLASHVNVVASLARAPFLILAAGDDISVPDRSSRLWEAWRRGAGSVGVVHSAHFRTSEGKRKRFTPPYTDEFSLLDAARSNPFVFGATAAYDLELLTGFAPLLPSTTHEDRALLFRSLLMDKQVAYIDTPLVHYRHDIGLSAQYRRQNTTPRERQILSDRIRSDYIQKLVDIQGHGRPDIEAILVNNIARHTADAAVSTPLRELGPRLLELGTNLGPKHVARSLARLAWHRIHDTH